MNRQAATRLGQDVAESLRSQPGRVALSFLAVMVGIVVLTLLLSMLFGLHDQSRALIRRFGANVAAYLPDAATLEQRGHRGLDQIRDVLRHNLPGTPVAGLGRLEETIAAWDRTPVWAGHAGLPALRGWRLREGRFLDPDDETRAARVALVTGPVARRFGLRPGSECTIGGHAFQVVGILDDGSGIPDAAGLASASSGESMALIPLATAERLGLTMQPASAAVFVLAGENRTPEDLIARADRLFEAPDVAAWGRRWITPESLIRGVRELQRLIALTAGSVALLCLVLGGTTLMSLMLADVRQRIPEIGLRRSLGATRRDVALLFVVESCVITGGAAIAGIALGGVLLALLAGRIAIPISLSSFTFIIPVIVSMLLGCVFSYWPARVAAGLSPAQALRNA